jgi:ketosteroid isomerase-like protein
MSRFLLMLALIVALPAHADTETEIRTALDYFAQVWNEDDLEAMQGYFHADFVHVNQQGRTAREQHLQNIRMLIDDGGDRGRLGHSEVVIKELGDQHAMASGHMVLTFDDGSAIDTWFSTVYVQTPFGWKALLTHN